MTSALIQALTMTQTTSYITTASAAAVAYDQVLNFYQEIDLIWKRRWSLTTALYLIARIAMYLAINWSSNIFVIVMQGILLMRIYALWNQSRNLMILLAIGFCLQAIAVLVMAGLIFNLPVMHKFVISVGASIGSVAQTIDVRSSVFFLPPQDSTIIVLVYDAIISAFALVAFWRHLMEARRLDGGWSMSSLVRIIDPTLGWLSISLATNYAQSFVSLSDVLNIFNALAVIAGPRMVINLRVHEQKTKVGDPAFDEELNLMQFGGRDPPVRSENTVRKRYGEMAA
ncbi:hypothetical protein BJ138DRAFT_1164121 [Hygrophoropsis aurantiaca]|uniref:Uncharacterized protein n=1 Tax=Hygrophoropsis aurantiaca TaxID=72124 RepID=A0ACB7ZXF4_9AGAM|nr:hypothetical protein BJ138DRAFT_1164121 [Hygrophoropsis aurantiaca]